MEQTLSLFAAGVDDVVRKPIHVREILARVGAIRRRLEAEQDHAVVGEMRVFFDGRDPEIKGIILPLPRRERRILEYLVANRGRSVSKAQIFNSIYGIFDDNVEENVVESHISKLRKKLRRHLGYDPINSVRYLGYRLAADFNKVLGSVRRELARASSAQACSDLAGDAAIFPAFGVAMDRGGAPACPAQLARRDRLCAM